MAPMEDVKEELVQATVPVQAAMGPAVNQPFAQFAKVAFNYVSEESAFEDALSDLGIGGSFTGISHDFYDQSVELWNVDNDDRLSPDAQAFIRSHGFEIAFLNHVDGWETHYNWHIKGEPPIEGHRVYYEHKQQRRKERDARVTADPVPGTAGASLEPNLPSLLHQVSVLKEALRFYADKATYANSIQTPGPDVSRIDIDGGERARKALLGESR